MLRVIPLGLALQILPSDTGENFESHFITFVVVAFIFISVLLLKNVFFNLL